MMTNKYVPALLLAGSLLAGGCATRTPPLYYWGDYQPQVYEYLKGQGKSPAEQILALEKVIQQANAANLPVPPGFHAHLAMLQVAEGKPEIARQEFEAEKSLFPESAGFMNFMLAKLSGDKK
jgi:hypothetical protein